MRLMIVMAAIAALSVPAFAQQGRPQQPQRPPAQAQPQPAQQPQQQETVEAAPGMFACRAETEICYIGVVIGRNQIAVLYTNDPDAEGIDEPSISVQARGGAPAALAPHLGRVVMLTGRYAQRTGLTNAEIVDVASPLLSFAIKSMLSGEGEIEEEEEQPPQQPPQQQPPRR